MRNKDSHDISALYEQVNKGKSKLVSEQMPPYGMGSEPIGPDAMNKVDFTPKMQSSGSPTFHPANWLRNPNYKRNFTVEQCKMIALKMADYVSEAIKSSDDQIYPGNSDALAKDLIDDVIINFVSKGKPVFSKSDAHWVAKNSIQMLEAAGIIKDLGTRRVKGGAKIANQHAAINDLFNQ